MYDRPSRIFANCAASVVPLPSGASHLPLMTPPTPVPNGVFTTSLGLLSLNGLPKKPQTTGPLVVGVTVALAWMCAAIRLSLVSVVCEPVKSILLTVAVNVIDVCVALKRNRALPDDAGLAPPVDVVGVVGGFSCAFVRVARNNFWFGGSMPALVSSESTYWALVWPPNLAA